MQKKPVAGTDEGIFSYIIKKTGLAMRFVHVNMFILFFLLVMHLSGIATVVKVDLSVPATIKAGEDFKLEIRIKKENISGFAKLELYLPAGFQPKVIETANSNCIYSNNLVKFIWIELPAKSEFSIIVSVAVDKRLNGNKEIFGSFYYIKDKERQKLPVEVIPIRVEGGSKSQIPENFSQLYRKKYEIPEPVKKLNQDTIYRVQIAAHSKRVPRDILEEFYGVSDRIIEEQNQGLYKYLIGDFSTRKDAELFRNQVGIYGAFVVVYKNGQRL